MGKDVVGTPPPSFTKGERAGHSANWIMGGGRFPEKGECQKGGDL